VALQAADQLEVVNVIYMYDIGSERQRRSESTLKLMESIAEAEGNGGNINNTTSCWALMKNGIRYFEGCRLQDIRYCGNG